jgi:uncharacterized protein (TIGR02996 family)
MRNAELEREIAGNPDDAGPYQVYADWLSDRGDPRGELIALSLALEQTPSDAAIAKRLGELHAAHDETWLGAVGRPLAGVTLTWRRGFVDEIMLGDAESSEVDMVEAYVTVREATRDAVVASAIRKLTLGAFADDDGEPTWAPVTHAMVEHGVPETLRELRYDRGEYWDISWTYLDGLDKLYPQLRRLETLYIQLGHMELGAIELPALRDFEVYTGGFTSDNMRSITAATWPLLERLILRFGDSTDYGASTELGDVLPLLATDGLARLRHLGLANCGYVEQLIDPLARSPLVPRLESLDLSLGALGDAGAQLLVDHRDAFRHLARLDVRRSYISPELTTSLRDTFGDAVLVDRQKAPREDNRRYCQIGE